MEKRSTSTEGTGRPVLSCGVYYEDVRLLGRAAKTSGQIQLLEKVKKEAPLTVKDSMGQEAINPLISEIRSQATALNQLKALDLSSPRRRRLNVLSDVLGRVRSLLTHDGRFGSSNRGLTVEDIAQRIPTVVLEMFPPKDYRVYYRALTEEVEAVTDPDAGHLTMKVAEVLSVSPAYWLVRYI